MFCHFVATGRVLRNVLSGLLLEEIRRGAATQLGCITEEVDAHLERVAERFDDPDSPVRRACVTEVRSMLAAYPALLPYTDDLTDVVRRFLRTWSFLVRYFPLAQGTRDEAVVRAAFEARDGSDLTLRAVIGHFFEFLQWRCGESQRLALLAAIMNVQTGAMQGREAADSFTEDEREQTLAHAGASVVLLPNVRLVNGASKPETRQRLMLAFNSPFFPEILIASSVLAEGVDLHRYCRHVIHHDLCWNPSLLEQRTGRLDRIGAKIEQCGQPLRVYLPYLAETQDEKQYRVVMDRERWFNVVMGEDFKTDARSTDQSAERLPLPASVAEELTLRLGIMPDVAGYATTPTYMGSQPGETPTEVRAPSAPAPIPP